MKYKVKAMFMLALTMLSIGGCKQSLSGTSQTTEETEQTSSQSTQEVSGTAVALAEQADKDYFDWKSGEYETIQLSNGSATIEKSGVYELTGTLEDGSIIVNVDKNTDAGDVYLVLNGADIRSTASAPIYIMEAKNVIVLLEQGTENVITQEATALVDESGNPKAALFSKADLFIAGEGTLHIQGNYNDGITSKDDLKIKGGTITVQAVNDGITGKDSVKMTGGILEVSAGKDGIRSTNETEADKGNVEIAGGQLTIEAGDDGIHAEGTVNISGGQTNIINSNEGVEGKNITVSSGSVSLTAADDGLNVNDAAGILSISGGELYVNAEGDGIDSNGMVEMSGGTVWVDGPENDGNGAIDCDGSVSISGGTLAAAGSSGMAQAPGDNSSQLSFLMYYSARQAAGSEITVLDSSKNVIMRYIPQKQYTSAVISSPELKAGESYTLCSDGKEVVTFSLSSQVTYLDESGVTADQSRNPGMGQMPGRNTGMMPPTQ